MQVELGTHVGELNNSHATLGLDAGGGVAKQVELQHKHQPIVLACVASLQGVAERHGLHQHAQLRGFHRSLTEWRSAQNERVPLRRNGHTGIISNDSYVMTRATGGGLATSLLCKLPLLSLCCLVAVQLLTARGRRNATQ